MRADGSSARINCQMNDENTKKALMGSVPETRLGCFFVLLLFLFKSVFPGKSPSVA